MRADLGKDPVEVAAMFDRVAKRYDITNDVLSGGQTTLWRKAVARAISPQPGQQVLDLAAGTGTSSKSLALPGVQVVSCDFSQGMLREGKRRYPDLDFVAGDALHLPFADNSFDWVTISFGLRNLVDTEAGLAEMLRVTKPGGGLLVCEFSSPTNPAFRQVYLEYLMSWLPRVSERVASNPDAYVYLAESIQAWPDQEELSSLIYRSGWVSVAYRNLTGGIVALHRARKVVSG